MTTVDIRDGRIGVVGGKNARLNLAGKPFRPPSLQRNQIGKGGTKYNLYVVMDNVSEKFDSAGALKDLGLSEAAATDALRTLYEVPEGVRAGIDLAGIGDVTILPLGHPDQDIDATEDMTLDEIAGVEPIKSVSKPAAKSSAKSAASTSAPASAEASGEGNNG